MSEGRQDKDEEVAEQIRAQLGSNPGIEKIFVKDRLLQLHVTDSFYERLAVDRDRGRKIVLMLMQSMKKLVDSVDVTVWVYCKGEKVIEGKVKTWGGDNVMYMYDL